MRALLKYKEWSLCILHMNRNFCDQLDITLITWAIIDICIRQWPCQHRVLVADTQSSDRICTAFPPITYCRLNSRWEPCRWFTTFLRKLLSRLQGLSTNEVNLLPQEGYLSYFSLYNWFLIQPIVFLANNTSLCL